MKKEIEVLKAKVEFHKTVMTSTMAVTAAFSVGYWSARDLPLARYSLSLGAVCMLLAFLYFGFFYRKRYMELIDKLRDSN